MRVCFRLRLSHSSRELPAPIFVVAVGVRHIWWFGLWEQRRPRGVWRFCFERSGTIRPCTFKVVCFASLRTIPGRLSRCSWRQGGGMLHVQAWPMVAARLLGQALLRWCEGEERHHCLEHCSFVAVAPKSFRIGGVKVKAVACVSIVGLYDSKVTW